MKNKTDRYLINTIALGGIGLLLVLIYMAQVTTDTFFLNSMQLTATIVGLITAIFGGVALAGFQVRQNNPMNIKKRFGRKLVPVYLLFIGLAICLLNIWNGAMSVFAFVIAAAFILLALLGMRQNTTRPVGVLLAIGAFIGGVIPGVIVAFILASIAYERFCQLSNSKCM